VTFAGFFITITLTVCNQAQNEMPEKEVEMSPSGELNFKLPQQEWLETMLFRAPTSLANK